MDNPLPYKEQQDCILHGITQIALIDPQELTPELYLIESNMAMAFCLNSWMFNRGLK
ncbi:hypothetical protein [Lactiplantibacillus plantarum]|uniref:hypothetical protein n=1 Tax=Lactiplantibacillus plantarum TaxID=1590 RepID=UPI003C1B0A0E